jgi:hypothetical protein
MREYNPDRWVMLKFNHNGELIYKILGSWYGGYAKGDSWKLNSGVTKIEEDGQTYLFYGSSGSVYRCHKNAYGMSGYTSGVYASFHKEVAEAANVTLDLMPEETNFMELHYE